MALGVEMFQQARKSTRYALAWWMEGTSVENPLELLARRATHVDLWQHVLCGTSGKQDTSSAWLTAALHALTFRSPVTMATLSFLRFPEGEAYA